MNNFLFFLGLVFLVLVQTVILPLNFAFALVWGLSLFNDKLPALTWIVVLSVIFSLFANLNLGLVILVLVASFVFLDFVSGLLPENNITKASLIGVSFLVCELAFMLFSNILK